MTSTFDKTAQYVATLHEMWRTVPQALQPETLIWPNPQGVGRNERNDQNLVDDQGRTGLQWGLQLKMKQCRDLTTGYRWTKPVVR